jgi:hypothetical protein
VNRILQALLIISSIGFSWLAFQLLHECGHIAAAKMTGGVLTQLAIAPTDISWSMFSPNPQPLLVAWGGPILGCVFPLLIYFVAVALRANALFLFKFFAGFCLVGNGTYMAVDAFTRVGDGATLITHGAAPWHLCAFAAVAVPVGLSLWHGLGTPFGIGISKGQVNAKHALVSAALFAGAALIGIFWTKFSSGSLR